MVNFPCENRSGYKSQYFGGIFTKKHANLSYHKRRKLQSTVNSVVGIRKVDSPNGVSPELTLIRPMLVKWKKVIRPTHTLQWIKEAGIQSVKLVKSN